MYNDVLMKSIYQLNEAEVEKHVRLQRLLRESRDWESANRTERPNIFTRAVKQVVNMTQAIASRKPVEAKGDCA
jgi:hypothetical protein